jgi:hypothetical protein
MIHVMLPVQYLHKAGEHRGAPERRLALAVLQTVLHDCRSEGADPGEAPARPRDREAYDRAMAYVMSPDRTWPYSFENLCETVGLDAGYLRRGIQATRRPTV